MMDKPEPDQEEQKIELSDVLGSDVNLKMPSAIAFSDQVRNQLKTNEQVAKARLDE